MGTGIVANAAVSLPWSFPGLPTAAMVVWLGAALLLILLAVGYLRQRALRLHAGDPVMAQFFGAPPMALLTVGAGALLLGRRLIGAEAALDVDWVLWSLGTVLGLVTACAVPYLMVTRHRFAPDAAFGGWLMLVVPPMVSAATGALLVPRAPAGQVRLALFLGCYAMLGLGLVAVLLVLAMIYGRLVHHEAPSGTVVPTVWIGVGALGQSVTALGTLAAAAPSALPAPYARGTAVFALLGGIVVWGFSMLWLVLATGLTVRTIQTGLPFAPTWWSFIFPVGACDGHRRACGADGFGRARLDGRGVLWAARHRLGGGDRPLPAPCRQAHVAPARRRACAPAARRAGGAARRADRAQGNRPHHH
jgi:tellurite resistance protein TehA-like permease